MESVYSISFCALALANFVNKEVENSNEMLIKSLKE